MALYGHELSEQIDPYQADLAFAVDLKKGPFPGRDELVRLKDAADGPRRVGLELAGRRIPRAGCLVLRERERIGEITSGTFSPTFQKPIAMGYLKPAFATPGTEVAVDIRGRAEPARIVKLPFYRRRTERKQP